MSHPRNAGYIKGAYWMRCDVCGFDFRRSQMKERWDALWTCAEDWEPRHPQEFVEGVPDYQAVPVARPDVLNLFTTTTLSSDMSAGDTSVTLTSVVGVEDGDSIGIGLDDGTIFWTVADGAPVGYVVTLLAYPFGPAASGNTVYKKGSSYENALDDEVVTISSATYDGVDVIVVTADSSYAPNATLSASIVTGVSLGDLTWNGASYVGTFTGIAAMPDTVTVTSSSGGTATYFFVADTVAITFLTYYSGPQRLVVYATSTSSPTAVLSVTAIIGGVSTSLGTLSYDVATSTYRRTFVSIAVKPTSVTVTSSGSGSATSTSF